MISANRVVSQVNHPSSSAAQCARCHPARAEAFGSASQPEDEGDEDLLLRAYYIARPLHQDSSQDQADSRQTKESR